MTATHTLGPWELGATQIVASVGGWDVHAIPVAGSGTAIGCVYAGAVGRPRSVNVEYANANLIAAAPELLAALEMVYALLTGAMTAARFSEAFEAARAAIAKATGGA